MFEHDNLENHFRRLAERHETPYNPTDWEEMQARLNQVQQVVAWRTPLTRVLKRVALAMVLVFLTGIKVFYDAPLPTYIGKTDISLKKKSPSPEIHNLPPQTPKINRTPQNNSATQNTKSIEQNFTNNLTQNAVNQSLSNQQTRNLPPEASPKITEKIANPELTLSPESVLSLNEGAVDSLEKQYNSIQPLLPLGFVVVEPFMQKELTESIIAELASVSPENTEKTKRTNYQHIEFFVSESLHTNIALKVGNENLYNIFTVGYQFSGGSRWGFGYGFGKELRRQGRGSLNLEVLGYYIKENSSNTPLNLLAQGKLQFNRQFTSRLAGFVGVSGNIFLSDYRGEDLVTSAGIPRWMVAHTFLGGTSVKLWTGINLGMNFRLQK